MRQNRRADYGKRVAAFGGVTLLVPAGAFLLVLAVAIAHVFFGAAGVIIVASLLALLGLTFWQTRRGA